MATEDGRYDSPPPGPVSTKRKFDDVGDKELPASGGNGPAGHVISSGASYNSVPPPKSDFELAKQKAEQIAARLVGNVIGMDGLKRARTLGDEAGGDDRAAYYDHNHVQKDHVADDRGSHGQASDYQQSHYYNQLGSAQSRKIDVPNTKVGLVIGKGGETIKYLQHQSGAKIQVTRDSDADPGAPTRQVELTGTPEQMSRAEQLIKDVLAEAAAGGSGALVARGFSSVSPTSGEHMQIRVPNNKVGLIIGRGGETIKQLQSVSGARIQFAAPPQVPNDKETDPGTYERIVTLIGNKWQTEKANEMIKEVIDESRNRPQMGGGYNPQGYRPPGPPQHWGPPPPPMQQQGYGYPGGAYPPGQQYPPGPPQQYGGYNQAAPGGYSSGWDQRSPTSVAAGQAPPAPVSTQQSQPASYDYYSQQGQTQQPSQGNTGSSDGSYPYGQQSYYGGYQQPAGGYNQSGSYEQGYGQPSQGQAPSGSQNQTTQTPSQGQGQSYAQQSASYNQQPDEYSQYPQSQGYQQPQNYSHAQGGYNQGYAQTAGYGYSQQQAPGQQTGYNQQGYSQQSYAQPGQYAAPPDSAASGAAGYEYNSGSQSTPQNGSSAAAPAAQT